MPHVPQYISPDFKCYCSLGHGTIIHDHFINLQSLLQMYFFANRVSLLQETVFLRGLVCASVQLGRC